MHNTIQAPGPLANWCLVRGLECDVVSATLGEQGRGVLVVVGEVTASIFFPPNAITFSPLQSVNELTASLVTLDKDNIINKVELDVTEVDIDNIVSRKVAVFCDVCEQLFSRQSNLNRHKSQHEILDGVSLACSKCPKVCADNHELLLHIKSCKFRCNLCSYSNSRKIRVEQHIRRVHKYDDM